MQPSYKDKKWLAEKYLAEKLSCAQIADICGTSSSTIQRWLGVHGIPARDKRELLRQRNQSNARLPDDPKVLNEARNMFLQGLTKIEIAERFGVTPKVIRRLYKLLGLKGYSGNHRDKYSASYRAKQFRNVIYDLYINKDLTSVEIGKLLNLNYSTVLDYARATGIPIKCRDEAARKRRGHIVLEGRLAEILDGELLGDGSLIKPNRGDAYFTYTTSRRGYLEWLLGLLASFNLEPTGKGIYKAVGGWSPRPSYQYVSKRYPELTDSYWRWYPNGKKRVPKDLVLTPITCLHWYLGDGSLKNPLPTPYITLSTQAFTKEEVEFLVSMLNEIVGEARIGKHPSGPVIIMGSKAARKFLEYIGPCPEPIQHIYGYKWRSEIESAVRLFGKEGCECNAPR